MKTKISIIATSLFISTAMFAQKDQIKAAEKALKNDNATEAKTILEGAETMITATSPEKAQFLFVKGNVLANLASKNADTNYQIAAGKAYLGVLDVEKATNKSRYTEDAQKALAVIKDKLVNTAVEEGKKENYVLASDLLKSVYDLDKTDVEKLYYAGNYAINGKKYDTALIYLQELHKLNYTGEGTNYYAKSVLTDKEDYFGATAEAKKDRDDKVKMKLYAAPRDEKNPSRRPEILKNITLILIQNNKNDEAKKMIQEARIANPDDVSLTLTEADLYYKLNDLVSYQRLVKEALEKNPNDVDLIFNLGVISRKGNQNEEAEKYFKRAIEINPNYTNAYLNLAEVKLSNDDKFVNEMNKLGTSEKDTKRYEIVNAERKKMFRDALPILEKANELDPKNDPVAKTLLSVYKALEMTDKAKELKARM
jgi:Tetratricopeptide repeat